MKKYHRGATALFSLFLSVFLSVQASYGAWGDFDQSFGFLGAAIDPVAGHYPVAVALQPDGKILVTGYKVVSGYKRFFLRRYLTNGSLDTSFGNNGSANPGGYIFVSADYSGTGIAVQDNGRIAVVGYGNGKRVVWRFYSNGSPDSSIGFGGMKTLNYAASSSSRNDAIEAQGNNLIVSVPGSSFGLMSMIRILSSGAVDVNFGESGTAETSFNFQAYRVSTEPGTGEIVVAGSFGGGGSFGLVRWFEDGTEDNSFQPDPQSSGVLVMGDHIKQQNGNYLMRETFLSNGFGGGRIHQFRGNGQYSGVVAFEYQMSYPSAPCPRIFSEQADSRVLTTGVSRLYRIDADLDTSTERSNTCGSYASMEDPTEAVLQADDKMIAAGRYNGYVILVRTLPN